MITARDVLPELYAGCDGLVELRALPSLARCFSTIGDTERRLAFAKQHQKQNLYWGVAARKSDENGTEANCQHLAALYADLDFSKTPETEARERLAQTPLSPSLIVNSGGGLHVYWFLREPLDVQHEQPRLWLQRLATYLHADPQCAEPARVLRVPGTKNYKYDPPRAVTVESFAPDKRYNLGDFDSWLPAASDLPAATTAPQIEGPILQGSRNDLLFRLARSLKAKNIDPSALRLAVQSVNQAQCHPPLPNAEVESIVRGAVTQANRPDFNGDTGAPGIAIVTCLADVRMRPIDWHWRQRFARGKATIVAGEPGVSKSSLWIDMVSRSTRGGQWPDGGAITACDCVIMTAEDALDDTVRGNSGEQLIGMGGRRVASVVAASSAQTARSHLSDRGILVSEFKQCACACSCPSEQRPVLPQRHASRRLRARLATCSNVV